MIQDKLEVLRLQLNYICYDSEMLSKLNRVWESFYELETEVKKLQQHGVMQAEGSDGVSGAAVGQRSGGTNAEGLEVTNIKTGQILSVEGYGFVFGRPDNGEPTCFSIGNESEAPSGGHL
jgi:hypothetical protein